MIPENRVVTADDIRWDLAPTPHVEAIPKTAEYLLSLPKQELAEYVIDVREDLASVRSVLHAATTALAIAIEKERRLTATIERLQEELRAERRRHSCRNALAIVGASIISRAGDTPITASMNHYQSKSDTFGVSMDN
jgi:hypothetical protein